MEHTKISIPVDAAIAQAYTKLSEEEPKKIQFLLALRIKNLLDEPSISLSHLMDEIGTKAEARGLNSEILNDLLNDE
ncbi:hypothetical protein PN497_24110 [Sphaerospermopsis kisseleviana CS-549]|uniref:Uncharacterized protein n=2 Tax=Sphaerospermopsis TaxID=752201 RepID=A0A480A0I0_9CYAN|nr:MULTISPECIES: hypothetical protein [Sphaerospermopsis]MDB9444414.1 hypothetical protein [Sphaerospermopsis kisseleviana CS-549]BAZ82460.1 hypothetical protein NIES73_37400 [Sphaerospermopsis kisseleviana NIES-73]GCL38307.1 hypothetical protein SR1949_34210 [Sphaerospermopsis reniformis]